MKNKETSILEIEDCKLAHVDYETKRCQSMQEHAGNVAHFSRDVCELPELSSIVELAGILHDAGKLGTVNQDDFKNNKLKDGQTLNAAGHFEIGKQFSAATIKTTDSYPGNGVTLNLKEEEQPDVYLNVLPVVTAENAGLHVQSRKQMKRRGDTS